jgi:dipeptidyl aminopeptidase/acylaminoacyl peptidase
MEAIPVEFLSEDECVRGRFYCAAGEDHPWTFLYVPGWPAEDEDFLGLGSELSLAGINMMEFYPRGFHSSEGISSFANTLQDIGAALEHLRLPEVRSELKVDPSRLVVGGYSYGGSMALAYAAQDMELRCLISIAGLDHSEFYREIQRNRSYAEEIRNWLSGTRAPEGPVRFDLDATLNELRDNPGIYGLRENAAKLADRSILMVGGWEDQGVSVEQHLLPFYRALKGTGAENVTFIVYHADHGFGNVYQQLARDITDWIRRGG